MITLTAAAMACQGPDSPGAEQAVWIDEFDNAWEEGTMFLLTNHPHIVGRRSRIVALEGLIAHIKAKGNVWFATHESAARYVRAQAGDGRLTKRASGIDC